VLNALKGIQQKIGILYFEGLKIWLLEATKKTVFEVFKLCLYVFKPTDKASMFYIDKVCV